jgi:hypothetical protein
MKKYFEFELEKERFIFIIYGLLMDQNFKFIRQYFIWIQLFKYLE